SAYSDPNLLSREVQEIDDEIGTLETKVRALRSRRNAIAAPTARLPNEILSKIFHHVRRANGPNKLGWIREVSHVCSYWRQVAINMPVLWNTPNLHCARWAVEMLKRSKKSPLYIIAEMTYMTPKMVETVQLALQSLDRTRELSITASTGGLQRLFRHTLSYAPVLESLTIHNSRYPYVVDSGFNIPDSFLRGDAPRLRRLEIVQCQLRWDSPFLTGLTHLKIVDLMEHRRPTIDQLVNVLDKMPCLELLHLVDALPTLSKSVMQPPHVSVKAVLPKLRMLFLTATVVECAQVLDAIEYPEWATVRLAVNTVPASEVDFSSIFPTLGRVQGGNASANPVRHMHVKRLGFSALRVSCWTDKQEPPPTVLVSNPACFELSLICSPAGDTDAAARIPIGRICAAFPVQHLRTLVFDYMERVSVRTWLDSFATLPKLRKVSVLGDFATTLSFIRAMSTILADAHQPTVKSRVPRIAFSRLRDVHLEDVNFKPEDELCAFEALRECLIVRQECQAGIRNLGLVECNCLTNEQFAVFQELVPDLQWDGVTRDKRHDELDDEDDPDDAFYYLAGGAYPSDDEDLDAAHVEFSLTHPVSAAALNM
ncbi:hypothetical protein FISHEDRAFT_33448, partial [Fistulina hepatica ATCC 64428]